jgi:hypothetical protein
MYAPPIDMTACGRHISIVLLVFALLVLPSTPLDTGNYPGGTGTDSNTIQDETGFCYQIWSSLNNDVCPYQEGLDDTGDSCVTGSDSSPPFAFDRRVTTAYNTPVEITLTATDPDGDMIICDIKTNPLNGTLGELDGNSVIYTPDEGFSGIDSFIFRADDGTVECIVTITITVEPTCSPTLPHTFYGMVTVDGKPAPGSTIVSVAGEGALPDNPGNPVATHPDGSYGSASGAGLVVEGCIEDGIPLSFFVDGVRAEVLDAATSGSWQPTYPFTAGGVTNLDLNVKTPVPPPPDSVYINVIDLSISNASYGYVQTIRLEKDPWVEIAVTPGIFTIRVSATGYHDFHGLPIMGRHATLAIYEGETPVSPKLTVPFGAKTVTCEYFANETKTFDVCIAVDESPDIIDVKHITILTAPA